MKYIIEHMDPELWKWSTIEYFHAAEAVGKDNLIITNVDDADRDTLKGLDTRKEKADSLGFKKACILDPAAEKELTPDEAGSFDCMVFGGILGNSEREGRTAELVIPGAERRNLGDGQFTTDNAVMVAKKIADGAKLSELDFVEEYAIEIEEGEEIIIPFRFIVIDGKTFIDDGVVEHVKKNGF